ncbi:AlbA family DNA-binding domain-containing protein [Leptospira kirschneri]|uniref:Divergent AAA domain protein n=1 Tax=Leptospira kirschneri str. H1 TaxID=1049966 RepID=A0A0E2B545_9LEPT|nr:ATP-binding protein [Leptospira kirschneri]EKO16394.1 divergent AAA domain protein [Leptospira kirschneri str. H1]UML82316.1 ATP-binding protein [Leptospira kirschneri]
MNNNIFENLLNESEGNSLDFKEIQYPFLKASEDEKSELLKDILSFANSWKRNTAYILIGVKESKNSRSEVIGIDNQIDDAQLQQFINSKINRPIEFRYYTYNFEGKTIGIIEIPNQVRPFYLLKDFGKLKQNHVYLRRGSSTTIAFPDEIAKMGQQDQLSLIEEAKIKLLLGNKSLSEVLNDPINLLSRIPNFIPSPEALKMLTEAQMPNEIEKIYSIFSSKSNGVFYKDVIDYFCFRNMVSGIDLCIQNNGSNSITNFRIESIVYKDSSILVRDYYSLPIEPTEDRFRRDQREKKFIPIISNLPKITEHTDRYEIKLNCERLLPGEIIWTAKQIFIGSFKKQNVHITFRIFADQLPTPKDFTFQINFEIENFDMSEMEWKSEAEKYE